MGRSDEEARQRIGAALDAIDAAQAVLRDTCSDLVGKSSASMWPNGWRRRTAPTVG
jgi:hypothetical protein